VLLDASVQDKTGRFVNGLSYSDFQLTENGEPQAIDIVRPETVPSTFALLSTAARACRGAWTSSGTQPPV